MLSTTEVGKLVGVTPRRVLQLLAERRDVVGFAEERAVVLPSLQYLRMIPEPEATLGGKPGWNEWEILRWRAYREGGSVTQRVEWGLIDPDVSQREERLLLRVLDYPDDASFGSWLVARVVSELGGGVRGVES